MRRLMLFCFLLFSFFILSSCGKVGASLDLIKADAAYNQGNFEKAIELYKKLIEQDAQKADLYWKIGIAYYSNGEKSNTQKQIIQLKKLGKNDLANDLQQLLNK